MPARRLGTATVLSHGVNFTLDGDEEPLRRDWLCIAVVRGETMSAMVVVEDNMVRFVGRWLNFYVHPNFLCASQWNRTVSSLFEKPGSNGGAHLMRENSPKIAQPFRYLAVQFIPNKNQKVTKWMDDENDHCSEPLISPIWEPSGTYLSRQKSMIP